MPNGETPLTNKNIQGALIWAILALLSLVGYFTREAASQARRELDDVKQDVKAQAGTLVDRSERLKVLETKQDQLIKDVGKVQGDVSTIDRKVDEIRGLIRPR